MHLYTDMTEEQAYEIGVSDGRSAEDVSSEAARYSAYRFRDSIQRLPRCRWHYLTQQYLAGWQHGAKVELREERVEEDGNVRIHAYAMPYREGLLRRTIRWITGMRRRG